MTSRKRVVEQPKAAAKPSRSAPAVSSRSAPSVPVAQPAASEEWLGLLAALVRSAALPGVVNLLKAAFANATTPDARLSHALAPSMHAVMHARPKYRRDQLLVTLASDVAGIRRPGARLAAAVNVAESVGGPFAALEDEGLIEDVTAVGTKLHPAGVHGVRVALGASVAADVDESLTGVNLVRLVPGASLEEVSRRLDATPGVRDIERVPYRTIALRQRPRVATAVHQPSTAETVPWNLREIGWKARTPPSAASVKVAVLDSGVDVTHPDLDIANYDHGHVSDQDIIGHGTHVCGTIAGKRSSNAAFYSGVSNAKLHVWKIFEDTPDPDAEDYVVDELLYQRALVAALEAGCKVLNLSIGGEGNTTAERNLIKRLIAGGVSVVAAMGNEYAEGNPTEYPAAFPDVIAVGAVRENLTRAPFSNTGAHITLVAPGSNIVSTLPLAPSADRTETSYAAWDGTSMATPHVTAAVARLLAASPTLSPADVKTELQRLAKHLPAMGSRTWTRTLGAGLLQI
jgi:subtilisin family serine protease